MVPLRSRSAPQHAAARPHTTTAAPPVRTEVGPPTSFDVLFTWWLVSYAAYWCFIRLPGRLKPQLSLVTRAYSVFNDFAWAAAYGTWGLWVWIWFDVLLRGLCFVLLPVESLYRLQLLPREGFAVVSQADIVAQNGGVLPPHMRLKIPPVAFPEGVVPILQAWRRQWLPALLKWFGGDSRSSDDFPAGYPPIPPHAASVAAVVEGVEGTASRDLVAEMMRPAHEGFRYRTAVIATTALLMGYIVTRSYVDYVRRYRRGVLPEQNLTMRDPKTQKEVPLPAQYAIPVPMLPKYLWVQLWALGVAVAFAWVKATPILTGILLPGGVLVLLACEVLMP